jgi:localization factor PodJL
VRQEAPSTTGTIAPEAWRALDEAARRDGLPLDQWLRAQLMGPAAGVTPPGLESLNNLAELRRRIEELAGQIGRIEAAPPAERAAVAPQPSELQPVEIQPVEMPTPREAVAAAAMSSNDRLAAAMREIDHRLAALQLSRRRAATPEAAPSPAAIEAAVAEIAARQSELDRDITPRRPLAAEPARRAPAAPVPEAAEAPALESPMPEAPARPAPPRDLFAAGMARETVAPPAAPAPLPSEALAALQEELAGLRQSIAGLAPRHSVDELQRVVALLVERVERSETRDESLRASLAALREMIGGLRLPEPPDVLLGRLAALERKIDIVNAKVVDGATVARLQAQIGEIRDLQARALSSDSLRLLAEQVSLLATRVAEMAASENETISAAFGALERRLDTLSETVAAPATLPLDDVLARLDAIQADLASTRGEMPAGLEALFTRLSERLEQIAPPVDDGPRFEALGRQIEALAQRVGSDGSDMAGELASQLSGHLASQFAGQLAGIERAVNDLFIQMEETRASLLAASQPRPPAGPGGDPETITALIRREIAALESRRSAEKSSEHAAVTAAAEAAVAAELASLAASSPPAAPETATPEPEASAPADVVFTPAPASIPKAFEPQLMRAALEALSRTAAATRRTPAASSTPAEAEAAPAPLPPVAANDAATSRATLIAQARRAASPTERPAAPRPAPAAPAEPRRHIGARPAPAPGRWLARIRAMLVIAVCGSALAYGSWQLLAQLRQEQLRAAGPATVPGPEDITGSVGNGAPRAPAPPSNLIFSR